MGVVGTRMGVAAHLTGDVEDDAVAGSWVGVVGRETELPAVTLAGALAGVAG